MLFSETADAATWLGVGTVAGAIIGALATAWIKISSAWAANQRVRERDAIADYQKLLDVTEAAKEKMEQSRDRIAADMNATVIENLKLKAALAERDATIAALKGNP